jgi:aminoglycoside phosphotransferase (APT) family kinase protein
LEWVSAHRGPVPAVRRVSTVGLPDGRRAACLIMDHADGHAPDSDAGWQRMGRTLAALTKLPWTGSGLPIYDPASFGDAHQQRLHDLAAPLRQAMVGVRDWKQLASRQPPAPGPLVITHGDPGPGNFLDNGHSGTLIDWEEAQVAHRGLDFARGIFIALLGSGPAGFVARDHHARARSVASGYLAPLQHIWTPGPTELRWWLTTAGVQFAHRRLQRAGQPAVLPWTDAITTLASALCDDSAWMPS